MTLSTLPPVHEHNSLDNMNLLNAITGLKHSIVKVETKAKSYICRRKDNKTTYYSYKNLTSRTKHDFFIRIQCRYLDEFSISNGCHDVKYERVEK